MIYLLLKTIHVGAVFLSGGLFFVRGLWMRRDSPRLQQRWVRVAPHIVDTVLLVSAIGLVFSIHEDPFTHAWLTAKVTGLFVYIALGMVALRYGRSRRIRSAAWVLAMATFLYIVSVALTRNPVVVEQGQGAVLYAHANPRISRYLAV